MTDLPKRQCAREGCEEWFTPKRENHRFHSERCRRQVENQRKRAVAEDKTLAQVLDETHLEDIKRDNAADLKRTLARESRMRRYEAVLRESLLEYEPTPLVVKESKHDHMPEHEYILVLSDWHTGLKVRLEETGGVYYQDVSTTRAQVAQLWQALESIHRTDLASRRVTKLNILAIGDFVDNDNMRPSQHRKVEDVMSVQTVQSFDLLIWFIRQALTRFKNVEVDVVGGNHDRLSQKAGDAGLGELDYIDTVAWLIGAFAQRTLGEDIRAGRLDIKNWETFFGYKRVSDLKVVFEHGSSFKWAANSYGGVPWYGVSSLGPKYESMLGGADLVFMGHGHRAAILPNGRNWVITNGALPATSTYVQSGMKTVSRPLQWLVSTHREHGVTGFQPLYADVPEALLPGMVWEDPDRYSALATSKSVATP